MQDRFVLQDPEAERFRVLPCRGPRIVTVKSARALKQCRPMAAGMPQAALEERGWGLVGAMEHGGQRRDRSLFGLLESATYTFHMMRKVEKVPERPLVLSICFQISKIGS
jgi:hypothetical protein